MLGHDSELNRGMGVPRRQVSEAVAHRHRVQEQERGAHPRKFENAQLRTVVTRACGLVDGDSLHNR